MSLTETIKCPCCGQSHVGEYDICPVCKWENDPIQADDPDYSGGANQMSLREAQQAFKNGEKVI